MWVSSIFERRVWTAPRALFAAFLILDFCAAPLSATSPAAGSPIDLTTAFQVHNLPAEQAPRARVHITGTITYNDPLDNVMFVQDASGGVFVGTDRTFPVRDGDLVEITGGALAGYRTEIAPDPVIRVLGRAPQPKAHPSSYAELATGKEDSQLIVIRGQVRNANLEQHENASYAHLDVGVEGEEVEVYLGSATGFDANAMAGASIEITAVAGGVFDAKSQLTGIVLYAPNISSIRVLGNSQHHTQELPLTNIDRVFENQRIDDISTQVRVRGTVTFYREGNSVVLQHDGKSIFVQTRQTSDIAIGDVVDAYGIPSNREYAPSLRQATLVKTGGHEEVTPRPVGYADALSGLYSDDLVSLTGVLVSRLEDVGSDTLVLNVDGHLVNGSLISPPVLAGATHAAIKAKLPRFELGSRIRIDGVCRIVPGGPWRAPVLFHIEMRSPADAQLLSRPSWWTVRHLAELLGALLVLATIISIWAVLLRKRISRQAERINRSMLIAGERSKILERVGSNHSLDSILSEICRSIMALLPGFVCEYHLNADDGSSQANGEYLERLGERLYFEMPLADNAGRAIGKIVVAGPIGVTVAEDQEEVYATLTELAILAVERYQLHQQLVHHSTHDHLTELPNRRLCEIRFQSALDDAIRHRRQLAVIYIDVNRFKYVNDRYGHKFGDLYLQQISDRLKAQTRSSDTLARIGGDEFLVIAPATAHPEAAEVLLQRLQACFDEPFPLEDQDIDGSASFGLAIYPDDGTTIEELKRNADHAMYLAKRKASGETNPTQELSIISAEELELALRRGHFRLAYQPQFSAQGRLTGMEALIRLEDPILGLLTPDAFISVAERHDVILGIGSWVLRQALQDAIRWQLHTGDPVAMVVNVSVRQLEQQDFADRVFASLADYQFPAKCLELEITERILISDREEVVHQLERLRAAGIRISLDDFGTGHSSLSLLHKLPIDTIKLDRSFIDAADSDPRVWPIIKAISFMAESMGKRIVAEGIEHVGPVPNLMKMAAMDFQGHLLSRPVAANKLDQLVQQWRRGIEMPEAFRKSYSDRTSRLSQQDHQATVRIRNKSSLDTGKSE